jgi:hypothetical protein
MIALPQAKNLTGGAKQDYIAERKIIYQLPAVISRRIANASKNKGLVDSVQYATASKVGNSVALISLSRGYPQGQDEKKKIPI